MKKLALLLAAMTAVSAVASAKEVVAAPVVAVEAVCPEPVIPWRPTGYVDLQYKYYGSDEFDSTEFGRAQLMGAIQMTPQQRLEYRVRAWNSYASREDFMNDNVEDILDIGDQTNSRLRYFYNVGKLGDTKIDLTHRLEYTNNNGLGSYIDGLNNEDGDISLAFEGNRYQRIQYQARFQFKDYFGSNDWFSVDNITLAPTYGYSWTDNSSEYQNNLGLDIYTNFGLPAGFDFEFNLYPSWRDFGGDSDSQFRMAVEAYLYYSANLYKHDRLSFDFNAEGGMDPYTFKSNKNFGKLFKDIEDDTYSAYVMPSLDLSYQATDYIKVYAGVAGEYRNWRNISQKSANDWTWLPQVYAGFRTTF